MAISIVGVQAHGLDTNSNDTIIRTDSFGRTKISHGQPPAVTGTITATSQTVAASIDGLSDAVIYMYGTYAGTNLTFEQSFDSTNGTDGTWFSVLAANQASASTFSTTTGTMTSNSSSSYAVSAPGASFIRVRSTAYTSGTLNVAIVGTTAARTLSVAANVNGSVSVTAMPIVEQTESSTNLAANATYTGASRDTGSTVGTRQTLVRPLIMHNAGLDFGTLFLDESTDGTTWRTTRQVPIPSDGSYRSFEFPIHLRYYRWRFTNGPTAQTGFYLASRNVMSEGMTMDSKNNLSFLLSTTALASAGTFTSRTLDLGDNHIWGYVRARVNLGTASTTATVRLESSHDGTVWATSPQSTATSTVAGIVYMERPVVERYHRLVVVNGSTAQASNQISLSLVSL